MSTLCIYHGGCVDGFTAAWVVNRALPNTEFYPGVYQEAPPDCEGREVLLVDFSYKRSVLLEMSQKARSITVLDHHKSAMADLLDLPENVTTIFDMTRSGARITWDYFFPTIVPGKLVCHVEDRDLWHFSDGNTRAFTANLFSYEQTFDNWEGINRACNDPKMYQAFVNEGRAIERKHNKDVEALVAASTIRGRIAGYDVPIVNAPWFFASDVGNVLAKGELFAACYYDTPEGRTYSLRSAEDGFDVSAIATRYGGGGHKHAAGFKIKTTDKVEL